MSHPLGFLNLFSMLIHLGILLAVELGKLVRAIAKRLVRSKNEFVFNLTREHKSLRTLLRSIV